jgi:hypothetical protein
MGTGISRIEKEFILKSIWDNKIPVKIKIGNTEYSGIILKMDSSLITLACQNGKWPEGSRAAKVRAFLTYYGHVMTLETKIDRMTEDLLVINYPANIYKNLERKYERVQPPENVKISFVLKTTTIELDFPRTEGYNPAFRPEVSRDFEPARIDELVKTFRAKTAEFVSDVKINMFRDKKPSNFCEDMLVRTGRMLVIKNIEKGFMEDDPTDESAVLTKDLMIAAEEEAGTPEKIIEEKLKIVISEKKRKRIYSEICCPVIYHEYVIGYIHMLTMFIDSREKKPINKDFLEYIIDFSKVLSYSLQLHGYIKGSTPEMKNFDAKIVDISASGLLFVHSSRDMEAALLLYSDLDLNLQIDNRKMTIKSRVMRKYREADISYYGILFLDMQPEDFRYLFLMVYGKDISTSDTDKWEGGAEPPPLSLFNQ